MNKIIQWLWGAKPPMSKKERDAAWIRFYKLKASIEMERQRNRQARIRRVEQDLFILGTKKLLDSLK